MLSKKGVLSAKKMCAGQLNLDNPKISPLYGNLENFIPTYFFIAENDIMLPDVEIFIHKLIQNNIFVEVTVGLGMPHCYPLMPLLVEAELTLKKIKSIITNLKN